MINLPTWQEPKNLKDAAFLINKHWRTYQSKCHQRSGGGVIYFIQSKNFLIKIGHANCVDSRFAELQRMSPTPLRLMGIISGDEKQEKNLHKKYKQFKHHGEWFYPDKTILEFINKEKN